MNRHAAYALLLLIASFASSSLLARQATVSEGKQVFRTYPFSDPDPVARMTNIYPYFRFEGYSITPVEKEWKVVTLENPYIRVLVAPEIGGKILGAFEKSTGKAFIYFNHVVKFREIAMRGPWTSGGIEFNFGDIGHTPATATPVDYTTCVNEDSSVSCIVGTTDLASRTEWRVEIRLPKDRAYFQTESFWYNPTDQNTSLYHWMNAAADATPDLQFLYPGTAYIDHSGEAFPWPIDRSGRDISRYANNDFGPSKSYHVLGSYTDTYAAYWGDSDFGVVHWSPYPDKPGKKIWIWARSREGEIWKNLLTDPDLGNNQYVEIQSGLLFNQAAPPSSRTPFKHEFLAPLSEQNFIEAWFPFENIGGLVAANLNGALNVRKDAEILKLGFCPLGRISQSLVVMIGGKEVYRKLLNLTPLQAFVDSLPLAGDGPVEVRVGDLISYRSEDAESRTLQRPLTPNKDFDWTSVFGLYTDGAERAKQRDYKGALMKYLECLSKDRLYSPALVGAAEIYYKRMEFDKALEYAKRALANDAYDPDANFIYGVINKRLGHFYDAFDGFGAAARSMTYRSAANAEMAEVSFLQKEWSAAEAYAFRAIDYDRSNVCASRLLPVLYRLRGRNVHASDATAHLQALDPLSHLADFENYLLDDSKENLSRFRSMIRTELPQEVYLELAGYYEGLQLYDEAMKVLQQSPSSPLVFYSLASLSERRGEPQKVSEYLREALALSPVLVYPFRSEMAPILQWADRKQPHWKTKYYLALLYWSKDREDIAKEMFEACGNQPDVPSFYLTRGNFRKPTDAAGALRDYRRAVEIGPGEWRAYHALVDFNIAQTDYAGANAAAKSAAKFSSSYVALFDLARTLVLNRQYGQSLRILDTLTVLPFEGAQYTHEVFMQACVLGAAEAMKAGKFPEAIALLEHARMWPERLGAGKPYEVDERLEDYLEGACRLKTGDAEHANALFERVASYTETHPGDRSVDQIFGALAVRSLGKTDDANRIAAEWERNASVIERWLWSVYNHKPDQVAAAERELREGKEASLLGRSTLDQKLALIAEVYSLYHF